MISWCSGTRETIDLADTLRAQSADPISLLPLRRTGERTKKDNYTRTGHLYDSRGRRHQGANPLIHRRKMRLRTSITFFWLDPISSSPKACLPTVMGSCSLWGPAALAYGNSKSRG